MYLPECSIDVNGNVDNMLPLLLNPNGGDGNSAYYLPDNNGIVHITATDVINLACPEGEVVLNGASTNEPLLEATCSSGSSLNVNGQVVSISGITCSRYPFHIARYTGETCLGNGREIEVGFDIGTKFIRHLTICFDDVQQNTLYALFDMPGKIGGYQSGFPRPGFIQDDFYNVGSNSVDDLYSRISQRETVNSLLGLPSTSTKYIQDSNEYFLSRGHLAAKADFIYGSQQRATFHFVNVAPQWQTWNGGNWNTLEMNLRSFIASSDIDVLVYTGTHGVTTLPHEETGVATELYIYVDENNNKGLPVPQYYWKVVYNPDTQEGIAFVGVNNPYHYSDEDPILCTDICDQISWIHWNQHDQRLGYSYCCTVDDLRQTVSNIPDFEVTGLLS